MSEKPPCDPAVYENGEVLTVIGDFKSNALEALIVGLRPLLREGVKLDWHLFAGRYVVKVMQP